MILASAQVYPEVWQAILQFLSENNLAAARAAQWLLILAAASNLAYHFPFLFSTLAQMRTENAASEIDTISG